MNELYWFSLGFYIASIISLIGYKIIEKYNQKLRIAEEIILAVDAWRGLDGDGISDPLRSIIKEYKLIGRRKKNDCNF